MKKHSSALIGWQKRVYLSTRVIRDSLSLPLVTLLTKFGCKPIYVSLARFGLIIPVLILVGWNNWIAFGLIVINLWLDSVDGALARFQKNSSKQGEMLDVAIDNFYIVFFVLALIHAKYLDGFWGALYLVSDMLNFLLNMSLADKGKRSFPFFKNTYLFYVFFLIFLLSVWNGFDYLAVFFGIYMLIGDGFMLWEFISLF